MFAIADNAADIAALQAVDKGWEKAFATANGDAIGKYCDEKAMLLPPNAPAQSGRAAIQAFLKGEAEGTSKAGVALILGPNPAGGVSGNMGWQSAASPCRSRRCYSATSM